MNVRELRKLLTNASLCEYGRWEPVECPDDWWRVYVSSGLDRGDYICECADEETARLIAAMHNALPELLNAWDMVQALRWAFDVCCECASNSDFLCPLKAECEGRRGRGEPTPCINVMDFSFEWLDAYRERGEKHADTK